MKKMTLVTAVVALALVTLACGISINLPKDRIGTGPTTTEEINIPIPDAEIADVILEFGAGELRITDGADSALIEGTARYNVSDLAPEIDVDIERVRMSTGDLEITGFPNINLGNIVNEWDLRLANTPMNLKISAGAYEGDIDLGGLSINTLDISDGASNVDLDFSTPNQLEMSRFRYITGASDVSLNGLANANFRLMTFRGGAGNYTLDFSGILQRDAEVIIESGISQITIIVPEGMSAEVTFKGGLTNIDADSQWQRSGSIYRLEAGGSRLSILVEMGATELNLRVR